jgi:dCMP deaminase
MTDILAKNKKYNDFYMDIALRVSQMSYAKRLKVGSILVKNNNIISYGWNGMPSGWDNDCEDVEWCSGGGWLSPEEIEEGWPHEGTYLDAAGNEMQGRYRLKTKPEVLHSEANCLMKIAKSAESSAESTMFCTHAPCLQCAKLIYQSGVTKLFYRASYRDSAGVEFLEKSGVNVEHYQHTS